MDKGLDGERYGILIVDDYISFRESVAQHLSETGADVFPAKDGKEALEFFRKQNIDIAIIDYFMPGMTGEALISEIRKHNKTVIIILVTSHSGEKPALEMLESLDIQGYYDKDSEIENLYLWVNSAKAVCRQSRQNAQMQEEMLFNKDKLAMLGLLISGISHNIRNPNLVISSSLKNLDDLRRELKDSIRNPSVTEKDIDEIFEEMASFTDMARRQSAYLGEILETVKGQAIPSQNCAVEVFPAKDAIEKAALLMDCELKKANCVLVKEILSNAAVKGKMVDLVQVINNLILNAIETYNGLHGKIHLKAYDNGSDIVIDVSDEAGGIPHDIAGKVLKEVVSLKNGNNRGLGLYFSNSVVKKNFSGSMSFKTDSQGTTFSITLPVER